MYTYIIYQLYWKRHKLHLQAGSDMLKHVFAFDHELFPLSLLNYHQHWNSAAFQDLFQWWFWPDYSEDRFVAVYGNLVKEYFNRNKRTSPFRQGYGTNIVTTSKWVDKIHIHAKHSIAMHGKVTTKTSFTQRALIDSPKNTKSLFQL